MAPALLHTPKNDTKAPLQDQSRGESGRGTERERGRGETGRDGEKGEGVCACACACERVCMRV